jgi:hypothetical protein
MTTDAMINMASRTDSIAIWPSSIKFSVSFPAPKGRFVLCAGLCLFSRIVFDAGQNRQKEPLLFDDDFMISRSF